MGRSVSEFECNKHQHHQQLHGVCPSCLREKLSHLCFASNREIARVIPSCSSSVSYSSVYSSPDRRMGHQRKDSEMMGFVSYTLGVGNFSLRKSRSMAFPHGNFGGEVGNEKKKKGFWAKLLGLKGKKEVLMHSKTIRERYY
ncbi:hypothetical protein SLE2022_297260 [Rubroshorea leprosula]